MRLDLLKNLLICSKNSIHLCSTNIAYLKTVPFSELQQLVGWEKEEGGNTLHLKSLRISPGLFHTPLVIMLRFVLSH